jgi:hypothetical protein
MAYVIERRMVVYPTLSGLRTATEQMVSVNALPKRGHLRRVGLIKKSKKNLSGKNTFSRRKSVPVLRRMGVLNFKRLRSGFFPSMLIFN